MAEIFVEWNPLVFKILDPPLLLHTLTFFQSTRREIGSETTDSECSPVKNANHATVQALIVYLCKSRRSLHLALNIK